MDDQLLGYLLEALEPVEMAAVEARLGADPRAQERLQLLRRLLKPLEADKDLDEPPPGLYIGAISAAAAWLKQTPDESEPARTARPISNGPVVPSLRTRSDVSPRWSSWRRWDAIAAAVLLVSVLGIGLPALSAIQSTRLKTECANNLRSWYGALASYSHQQSDGHFPFIGTESRYMRPASFVPILLENGHRPDHGTNLTCPAEGRRPLPNIHSDNATSVHHVPTAYAYTLGYRDHFDKLQPICRPRHGETLERMPLMADRPPASFLEPLKPAHPGGPLHGKVVNVLFAGGHVEACTSPRVGINGDHIYMNQFDEVRAGIDPEDGVLADGDVEP
jgi:prepilin-type processing-associated H-X9-DG protein